MLTAAVIPPALSVLIGLLLAGISVIKGKFRLQNVLFALVIIWWSLVSAAFVFHQVYAGDTGLLLDMERMIHRFYVFVPVVNLLFFHNLLNVRRRILVAVFFGLSTVLCILVPTELYFIGLHTYTWGSIAAGGVVSNFVGIYGLAFIVYTITLLVKKFRNEDNRIWRLKIKYILISVVVIAVMQVLNLPAMHGIDLYPVGNFIFIPLLIMAYGILHNKLMDVQTILHVTFTWGIVSSLALLLNVLIFVSVKDHLARITDLQSFMILIIWFIVNYCYFSRIQPKIDSIFNKRKLDLKKTAIDIIGNILKLKTLDELSTELTNSMKKTLCFNRGVLFINDPAGEKFYNQDDGAIPYGKNLVGWLAGADLLQKDQVKTDPFYTDIRDQMTELFSCIDCDHIVPLVQDEALIAILGLNERKTLKQLNKDELAFISSIVSAVLISLANSSIYQDLKNLKNNLETMVDARTAELRKAMRKMEQAHKEIKKTKNELQNERDLLRSKNKTMEDELVLARKIQEQFIPTESPSEKIHFLYKPMRQIGGDFFDFLKFRDSDKTGIFVSDVSGHGVPAAFITSMMKTLILQTGILRGDPAGLLGYLNQNLLHHSGGNFITAIYCIYDSSSRELVFANAGHNPPYIVCEDTTIPLPGSKSIPLAIIGNQQLLELGKPYQNNSVVLKKDSKLVLYTDGLTESTNIDDKSVMFEKILKKKNFFHQPQFSIEAFTRNIFSELVLFRGNDSFDDDICIICMDIR